MTYVFQVVTRVPPLEDGGNLAIPHVPLLEQIEQPNESNDYSGKHKVVEFGYKVLVLRQPVFTLGEVIITHGGGREAICGQRKASKWDVEVEDFSNIDDAVQRSLEVTA